jgi:ATP-dependent RNA helicase RhlB
MSLPDIEAYIEQKIPSEPVTQALLTALPRPERPKPEAGADGDSIGEIFKEVREARAAEDAKRGGSGRGGRSNGNERPGARRGNGSDSRGPRPPRKPRVEVTTTSPAVPATEHANAKPQERPQDSQAEGERGERKRRRRRRGQPLDAGNVASVAAPPTTTAPRFVPAKPAASTATESPSLLARIGRGLKSLVTRSPNKQH